MTNAGNPAGSRRGGVYKKIQRALTETLRAMATLHSVKYPGWTEDKNHAGYLIKFDAPMLFRVPYHVLPSFPTGNQLQTLWQLSRTIRSGDRSVISLSGSNVLRKIFDVVGDIDFCEYFFTNDSDGFSKIASNMDGTEKIVCLKVAVIDKQWGTDSQWLYPWDNKRPTKEVFYKLIDKFERRSINDEVRLRR